MGWFFLKGRVVTLSKGKFVFFLFFEVGKEIRSGGFDLDRF